MRVSDIMRRGGNLFIRSEYNQIGGGWPCIAFTKPSHLKLLQQQYRRGDVIFAIGTTNPAYTKNPDHRSKLLTVYTIEPNQHIHTKEIVPAASWRHHVLKRGAETWTNGLPALRIFQLRSGPPFPDAHVYCPEAYASMGDVVTRGRAFKIENWDERAALKQIAVDHEEFFTIAPRVADFQRRFRAAE
jgi:hypothetical protein